MEENKIDFNIKHNRKGKAYISIYNFKENFVKKDCFISDYLKDKYRGGFGAMIFADYSKSGIGPYQELLFIPGKFELGGEERYLVTKAYVNEPAAVNENGEGYFGHKKVAKFRVETLTDNKTLIAVNSLKGEPIVKMEMRNWCGVKLPISSSVTNFPLMQLLKGNRRYLWKYEGQGNITMAKIESAQVRPAYFPDIAQETPMVTFLIDDFSFDFEEGK